VSKLFLFEPLELALSEEQTPQLLENIGSVENPKKLWSRLRCV
jgi:hypothetical protein